MLVIGRKRDEKLIIAGNIEITVLKVGRNHVKFGVEAPREVSIQTKVENKADAKAGADVKAEAGPAGVQEDSPSPDADEVGRKVPARRRGAGSGAASGAVRS